MNPVKLIGMCRRPSVRFRLRLPVIFHWGDARDYVEGGFTKDIARDETFVVSRHCPPIGSEIRIEVLVPSSDLQPRAVRIESVGKVAAVVDENGLRGFLFRGRFDDSLIREEDF
jgi:hypothetical protein